MNNYIPSFEEFCQRINESSTKKRYAAHNKADYKDWLHKVNVQDQYDKNIWRYKAKPGTQEYEAEKAQAKQKGEQFRKNHKNLLDKGAGILYKSKNIEVYSQKSDKGGWNSISYTIHWDYNDMGQSFKKKHGDNYSSRYGSHPAVLADDHNIEIDDWHLNDLDAFSPEMKQEYLKAYDAIADDINDFYNANVTADDLISNNGDTIPNYHGSNFLDKSSGELPNY